MPDLALTTAVLCSCWCCTAALLPAPTTSAERRPPSLLGSRYVHELHTYGTVFQLCRVPAKGSATLSRTTALAVQTPPDHHPIGVLSICDLFWVHSSTVSSFSSQLLAELLLLAPYRQISLSMSHRPAPLALNQNRATSANLERSKVQRLIGQIESTPSGPASSSSRSVVPPKLASSRSNSAISGPSVDAMAGASRARSRSSVSMENSATSKDRHHSANVTPGTSPAASPTYRTHSRRPSDTLQDGAGGHGHGKGSKLASVPSKVSLRTRLFGLKGSKASSPSSSSLESSKETPSPKSGFFPPSIYSTSSQSDVGHVHSANGTASDPSKVSPNLETGSTHSRDNEHDPDDTQGARKSSASSSLLRKTIRFKDKSAFLRSHSSASSLTLDAPSSPTTAAPVPVSPVDSGTGFRPSPYKQISGRRGLQYHESESPSAAGESMHAVDTYAPTDAECVSGTELAAPSNAFGSVSSSRLSTERSNTGSPTEALPLTRSISERPLALRTELEKRKSTSSIYSVGSSGTTSNSRSFMTRSSSLHGHGYGPSTASKLAMLAGESPLLPSSPMTPAIGHSPNLSRRPRSGSGTVGYAPHIQPRTTSSPASSPLPRAGRAPDSRSPHLGQSNSLLRSTVRSARPKTADSSHGYSNSLSSLRDILMVANAISEEGAVYSSPDSASSPRFRQGIMHAVAHETIQTTSGIQSLASTDAGRPGLPPKNPLRNRRPTAMLQSASPPAVQQPVGNEQSGSIDLPAPPVGRHANAEWQSYDARLQVTPSSSSCSMAEYGTPMSDAASLTSVEPPHDYFRSAAITRGEDSDGKPAMSSPPPPAPLPKGLSASASQSHTRHERPLTAGSVASNGLGLRRERAASDGTLSIAHVPSPTDLSSGVPLPQSGFTTGMAVARANGRDTGKDAGIGAGSKFLAFARDFGQRDGDNDGTSTFRLGRKSKSKKGEALRPVIRRVYDTPPDAGVDAHGNEAQRMLEDARRLHVNMPEPISTAASPAKLSRSASYARLGSAQDTPRPPPSGPTRQTSVGLTRSSSSSGSVLHEVISPASSTTTPNMPAFGSPFLGRSPNPAMKSTWSIPQDDLDADKKRLVKRWFILRELLETERSYASDLAVARDIYLAKAKLKAGIVFPLSPLSVRSASAFSQLTNPEASPFSRSSQPSLQRAVPSGPASLAGHRASPGAIPRTLFRHASAETNPHHPRNSPAAVNGHPPSSASLNSSNPSNRSSTYTVSSQHSSQTSDTGHLLGPLAPGLPGTPHLSVDSAPGPLASFSARASAASSNLAISPLSSGLGTPVASTPSASVAGFNFASDASVISTPDAPLSASDVRIIFAQLEASAALADEMVAVLEVAVGHICSGTAEEAREMLAGGLIQEELETDKVGQAFLKLMPRIEQVYTAYCSRHQASMTRLQELASTQPRVAAFLNECTLAARSYTNAWDLASLLIKPVQRVLKYPLLLDQILSATSDRHPDAHNLRAACGEIQKVADHINEVKKRKDLVEQIVSGKSAKRTTSQRVQHGTTKKLLRRQEKVKHLVLGATEDIMGEEVQYKALIVQFRNLDRGVASFGRRCLAWSQEVRDVYLTQLRLAQRWRKTYMLDRPDSHPEASIRLGAYVSLLVNSVLGDYWEQMDSEIRNGLIPAIQRIESMFVYPRTVIAKRDDRELDYTRFRAESGKNGQIKSVDKKVVESSAAFVALHSQLMDEIPQFNYGVQTLLDICIESLSRTQATFYLRVHKAMMQYRVQYDRIDEAQRAAAEADGSLSADVDTGHPDLGSQIAALTAARPEELAEPPLPTLDAFATPPLGSTATGEFPSQSERLLGSPAQISPAPASPLAVSSAPRGNRSPGGLIGLLRSVGSNSALVGTLSRKGSQTADTMYMSASHSDSDPPTPISKDTPLMSMQEAANASLAGHSVSSEEAPTLPVFSFNSGLFAQPGNEFLSQQN
ncbi:hypothetical protein BCV70DRAFT_231628 [Testicularia cyperi]|uniref:Dynamin-binding protein n=1 Tax=Testicularia cyperi TaxID=1882483 RepID=A0A317XNR4_9BASI|nr:hypothetical protein BCV70DRAFT_231628 [Testicularia cyperi]